MPDLIKFEATAMDAYEMEFEESGGAIEVTCGEPEQEIRRRAIRRTLTPPNPIARTSRARFEPRETGYERADREEKWYAWAVSIGLICVLLLVVLAHRYVLSFRTPPAPPASTPASRDRFVYRDYSRIAWDEYLANHTRCVHPSASELEVWRSSGEVCDGTCLRVDDVLAALRRRATAIGEAYSSMGRAKRGAPVPCALATRDERGNVTVYLAPRIVETSGRAYRAAIEVPFFSGGLRFATAHRIATVEHIEWPSGERVRARVEGVEAAQWSVALFLLTPS